MEFAASVVERVIVLGDRGLLADGPASDVLDGSLFFSTQINRLFRRVLPAVLREDEIEWKRGPREPDEAEGSTRAPAERSACLAAVDRSRIVALVAAGYAVLDPRAVNWSFLSLVLIAAIVGLALVAYGLRDSSASGSRRSPPPWQPWPRPAACFSLRCPTSSR